MDTNRLDSVIRNMAAAPSRRAMLSLALGGVLARFTAEPADAKKKNKGKSKKGCPKGKKKCGNKCISKGNCCTYVDCTGCRNEDCINGTCQCNPELIMHNGMCGFFTNCKSFGETCIDHEECCGPSCVNGQCAKSIYHCLTDSDCLSGPCRGFLCPEGLEPYFDLCRP
jgi:hypothetical protein